MLDHHQIPVLETPRLRLRGHERTDFNASMAMWCEPAIYRYISGKPASRSDSWGRLLRYTGHWMHCKFGYWVVEELHSGQFVGEVGFGDFRRDMTPSIEGTLEAGWCLASAHHGKGYALEAVQEIINWARDTFPEKQITCIIHPENAASIKVAQKAGFQQRCIASFSQEDALLMDWHA